MGPLLPAAAVDNGAIAERELAQTGLAIGFASTVLQSQFLLVVVDSNGQQCQTLPGGVGSGQSGPAGIALATLYYDNACTKPYLAAGLATAGTNLGNSVSRITEPATYYGLDGSVIGSMALTETIDLGHSNMTILSGVGLFKAANGAPPVQLGVYCSYANAGGSSPCAGGIAQDFPSLGIAIGAVTPLTLTTQASDPNHPVSFTGGGTSQTGPLGSLTLNLASETSLVIQGGTIFGSTTASGGAAAFTLFPPTPTSWTLTDAAHDREFRISVVDDTTRNLTLQIVAISTGAAVATGGIDQSGTGSITFSDGSKAPITSWTIGEGGAAHLQIVSSAAGVPALAPGSLASLYGSDMATGPGQAKSTPLPPDLNGTTVKIVDSSGAVTSAPLLYVNTGQVNFYVPPAVATGTATLTVTSGDGTQTSGQVDLTPLAPALFTLNPSGLAAAIAICISSSGAQTPEKVYAVSSGAIVAAPIDLNACAQTRLELYTTGMDKATESEVQVTIAGNRAAVKYVGPQGTFIGLDQINIVIPQQLAGAGSVPVVLTANGQTANTVNITIR